MNAPDLTALANALERLHALQRDARRLIDDWPALDASRLTERYLDGLIKQLQSQLDSSTPLSLLLLGGTGVGKSSLLNAIAERELASVSHTTRAHTATFTLYLHEHWRSSLESTECLFWDRESVSNSRIEYHHIESLRALCFIDAPDVDSIIELHRDRVLQALSLVDAALWVSSPQKYRDRSCKQVLQLIDCRRPLLAVMNQIDLVVHHERAELIEDAQSLCTDLGFTDVQWFECSTTPRATSSQESEESEESEETTAILLRTKLIQRFNLRERERLKSLSIAQRLHEDLATLSSLIFRGRNAESRYQWTGRAHKTLTPLIHQLLVAHIREEPPSASLRCSDSFDPSNTSPLHRASDHICFWFEANIWPLLTTLYQSTDPLVLEREITQARSRLRSEELRCLRDLKERELSSLSLDSDHLFEEVFAELSESLVYTSFPDDFKQWIARLSLYAIVTWITTTCIYLSMSDFSFQEESLLYGFIHLAGMCLFLGASSTLAVGWWIYRGYEATEHTDHEDRRSSLRQSRVAEHLAERWVTRALSLAKEDSPKTSDTLAHSEVSPQRSLFLDRYESSFRLFEASVQAIFERE